MPEFQAIAEELLSKQSQGKVDERRQQILSLNPWAVLSVFMTCCTNSSFALSLLLLPQLCDEFPWITEDIIDI